MKSIHNIVSSKDRFETAYSKSGGFNMWDSERDLDFLIRTSGVVGFSTAEECATHQLVYISNLDCLNKIPQYLFGLPVIVYLERRIPSYRDEEVIHELVREAPKDTVIKKFLDYIENMIMKFI